MLGQRSCGIRLYGGHARRENWKLPGSVTIEPYKYQPEIGSIEIVSQAHELDVEGISLLGCRWYQMAFQLPPQTDMLFHRSSSFLN